MAACSIFDEDEVCMPTSSGGFKYGLVVVSSEYVSSDEEEDEDIEDRVQKGKVKVAWHPSGKETVVSQEKVMLTDRSLMPGDVVRRLISGKESQRGFVQECHTKCHVRVLGTEYYIYNVDARDLKPLQEFDPEPEVTLNSWVGHVVDVTEEVAVKFPCGARCKFKDSEMSRLQDVNDNRIDYSEFCVRNYYVGQELVGAYEDYEDVDWIYTTNVRGPKCKAKHLMKAPVQVEEVKTHSVEVTWTCKGFTQSGAGTDQLKSPPDCIVGDNLKCMRRLDCFEYCHMQIGDKGYYVVKDSDTVLHKMSPRKHMTPDIIELAAKENVLVLGTRSDGLVVKQRGVEKRRTEKPLTQVNSAENDDNPCENCDNCDKELSDTSDVTKDDADSADDEYEDVEDEVSDRDGEESDDGSSAHSGHDSPTPRRRKAKTSYLKGRNYKKREKKKRGRKKSKRGEREVKPGERVPVEIWYTFTCCDVMWQDGHVEKKVPSPELFPIHHLDELEFFPGDFVQDNKGSSSTEYGVVMSSDYKERTVMVKWFKAYKPGQTNIPESQEPVEVSVFDVKDHPDYKFRCGSTVLRVGGFEENKEYEAVGQVYRLDPEGTVQVWWPDNTITKCFPQDLFLPGEEFLSDSEGSESSTDSEGEEEGDSEVSWETEEEESASDADQDASKNKGKHLWSVDDAKKKELDALLDRAQAALTGLLNTFVTVAGPFFKNSREIFQDILAIFKRCKEVEKIFKSTFFEDEEIASLIEDIKDEIRKEKTAKLARHVADVYKYRTGAIAESSGPKQKSDETKIGTKNKTGVRESENAESENQEQNADAKSGELKSSTEHEILVDAIMDIRKELDDPLLEIIFDSTIATSIKLSEVKRSQSVVNGDVVVGGGDTSGATAPSNGQESSATAVGEEGAVGEAQVCHPDMFQALVKAICDTPDRKLKAKLQEIQERVKSACNDIDKTVEMQSCQGEGCAQNGEGNTYGDVKDEKNTLSKIESQDAVKAVIKTDIVSLLSKEDDAVMAPSHRTLCIRVCKALNARLMHIKQEVNRKWLAYKFGCEEGISEMELFEKMQEKMIESVESGRGPLPLSDLNNDSQTSKPSDEVLHETDKESKDVESTCIAELKSMDSLRNSQGPEMGMETAAENGDTTDTQTEMMENNSDISVHKHVQNKGFEVLSEAPFCHRYKCEEGKGVHQKAFLTAVRKEWKLLQTSLPDGIFVKVFEDRMDLVSVLIKGPAATPYEDGLFAFDVHLPADFPSVPPVFHYLSFCSERLNPNLYEDGKVCVSLLGTWTGKGSELWTVGSSLLQVLVSIQGLILVKEPYYNEAGFEKQRGSQHGKENSRMYNEMAVLKLIQHMTKMTISAPGVFSEETKTHLKHYAQRMIDRVEHWIDISNKWRSKANSGETGQTLCNGTSPHSQEVSDGYIPSSTDNGSEQIPVCKTALGENVSKADFPLLPASKGFCITVRKHLDAFKEALDKHTFTSKLGHPV